MAKDIKTDTFNDVNPLSSVKEGELTSLSFIGKFPDYQDVLEQTLLEEIHHVLKNSYVLTSCVITAAALREVVTPGCESKWREVDHVPTLWPSVFQVKFYYRGEMQHILTIYHSSNDIIIYQSFWKQYSLRIRKLIEPLNFKSNSLKELWQKLVKNPPYEDDCGDKISFLVYP